jgi:integrase
MARHTVGTMLNAQGASLRTIMDRLGHTDVKSSLRYQGGDIEVVREAGKRLPRLT